ncbi:hypothetical protein M413DRAFT_253835 [Hebeloma cylindrosporum]|uniref:Uncharacterized protein n=1 Tax=Hebeloma cylindrosporum TaxID=76867 RepID=A0A0C2Y9K6_HEBCY|nr:hypothetical protein M413DRAFT_253835 [Hebeloma cylindrosporum h7]
MNDLLNQLTRSGSTEGRGYEQSPQYGPTNPVRDTCGNEMFTAAMGININNSTFNNNAAQPDTSLANFKIHFLYAIVVLF